MVMMESLAGYRVVRQLGAGGMGEVYEGLHPETGQRVAIKLLLDEHAKNAALVQRFLGEARALTLAAHEHVVRVFDCGALPDGGVYLVMEFLEGETLRERLSREGRFPVGVASRLCLQVASALSTAHERGIVHRDLKPDNIMLVPDPSRPDGVKARLLDFGIAKVLASEHRAGGNQVETRTGVALGTPHYMPPEQFRNAKRVGSAADVYGLGVLVYELLAGQVPFPAQTLSAAMMAHLFSTPTPLLDAAPWLPPELASLVDSMLAKVPHERPLLDRCIEVFTRYATLEGSASDPRAGTLLAGPARFEQNPTVPDTPSNPFPVTPAPRAVSVPAAPPVAAVARPPVAPMAVTQVAPAPPPPSSSEPVSPPTRGGGRYLALIVGSVVVTVACLVVIAVVLWLRA